MFRVGQKRKSHPCPVLVTVIDCIVCVLFWSSCVILHYRGAAGSFSFALDAWRGMACQAVRLSGLLADVWEALADPSAVVDANSPRVLLFPDCEAVADSRGLQGLYEHLEVKMNKCVENNLYQGIFRTSTS